MIQITTVGRVTADLELKESAKKGSQIMISGDLDVVDFERSDGSKGKAN
mgnify:CR=1 FL=1